MKKTPGIKHSAPPARASFFGKHLPGIIVFGFVILLYANSIPNNYNLDDELVTRTHKLTSHGISAIPEIFSSPYYTDEAGYSYEYRPVVLSSFAIEYQFFGDNPYASHFFNLLLYALCCVVLYRVVYLFLPGRPKLLALCIALLFAAYPAHTEVVCSIKNRDDILALLFGLLAMYAAYKSVSTKRILFLALVPVLFVFALLSKTTILSFVVIIPMVLIFFTEVDFKRLIVISLLLLVPTLFAVELNFLQKLFGSLILVSGLSLFFMIVRSKTGVVLQRLKNLMATLTSEKDRTEDNTTDIPGYRGLKILLSNIKPNAAPLRFIPAVLTVLAGGLYFWGVYEVFPAAVIVAAVILGALIIWGDEPTWWWASVMLYVCMAFAPMKYSWNKTLYGELVSAILMYHIFYGNRKLFIPTAIIFIIYSSIGLHLRDFPIMLNRLVGVVGLRVIGWPAIIWQGIPIHNFFKHRELVSPTIYLAVRNIGLGSFFITLFIISLIFKTGTRYLIAGYVILAIGVMFYLQAHVDTRLSLYTVQTNVVNTVNGVNPKFIQVKQDRPLDFVEQPVTNHDELPVRAGTAFEVICHYFIKTILPYPMAFYYGYSIIKPESITDAKPLTGLIIYLLLIAAAIALIHKNKLVSVGLFIYLLSLVIFSGYFYPVPGQVAERFMLIPSMGWCLVLGFALFGRVAFSSKGLTNQWKSAPMIARAAFLIVLTFYSVITFSRNFNWKDDITLFRHDISSVEESVQAQNILATHLVDHSFAANDPAEQKELREEAIAHFKMAVGIRPSFFNPTYDLGRVYLMLNMPDSALVWFIKANNINPDYTDVQYNIADLYMQKRQFELAAPYLEYAVKHRPEDYMGYNKLSYIYFMMKDFDRSIAVSREAILKTKSGGVPYVAIASVYLSLNKPDSAATWAHRALEVEPANQGAVQLLKQMGSK